MRTSVPTWFVVAAARARTLAPTSIFLCYTPTVFFKSHFLCPRVTGMKLRPLVFPLAVLFASSFSPTISGAQATPATPRPITVDDYFQVREVDDPQISADGQWVAYTVTTSSLKDDEDKTRIWMVPTAGGDAVAMTSEESSSRASTLESGRKVSRVSFQAQ